MARQIRASAPQVVYSMDLAIAPTLAWLLSGRRRFIVDTGDAPRAFLDLIGASRAQRGLASLLERVGYGSADRVIVRGEHHRTQLRAAGHDHVSVIADGVDRALIRPVDVSELRHQLGLADKVTVGIQGNFTWYDELGGGMGWELVHAIARRPDLGLHAVLIGDGPGITQLRSIADELGVSDRIHVMGRVPYGELSRYLSLCDFTLLTQTDDPSSWARTTGKLPTYLASGRHILASRVGTAADVLPEEHLIDYHGPWDLNYPDRLADRLAHAISQRPAGWRPVPNEAMQVLADQYDYDDIAARCAREVLEVAQQ